MRTNTLCIVAFAMLVGSAQAAPFSVEVDDGFNIKLNDCSIAVAKTPEAIRDLRVIREKNGFTGLASAGRQEAAVFDDRLEYTYDFRFQPRVQPWTVLFLPLTDDATVTLVHGNFEKPPKTSAASESPIPMVRFITVRTAATTFSLDTQPAGCMGEDPADAASIMRTLTCRRVRGGMEIRVALKGSRASYPARMRAKFIFYADGRSFRDVHPFIIMNYRYAFEKAVKLDFTRAPMPKKAYLPRSVRMQPHDRSVGYGWVSDPKALEIKATSLRQPIYGDCVTSNKPGRFRVDVPPGHYYLTLNLGSADNPTGPMRVSVNGRERISRFSLPRGRFKAEVLWVVSRQDHLDIEFDGLDGTPWRIGALTVSSLGTLNEDFTLTRSWWHFEHRAD